MHIELRNTRRERLFAVDVSLFQPPSVVQPPVGSDCHAVHLDWDRAIDDEHHLRRCPVCGCDDLFMRKALPQVTAFAIIVFAAVVAMMLHGIGGQPMLALALFIAVTVVDVAIYLFTSRQLVCYRCRSAFSGMPIRRDHAKWDKTIGDQYPPPGMRAAHGRQRGGVDQIARGDSVDEDSSLEDADSDADSDADEPDAESVGEQVDGYAHDDTARLEDGQGNNTQRRDAVVGKPDGTRDGSDGVPPC